MLRSSSLRMIAASSARRGGKTHWGTPLAHQPAWIDRWEADRRTGKDRLDWMFAAFNKLRLYENFMKSAPIYYGFVMFGCIGVGYYWGQMIEAYWCYRNKGKLYRDCPYVYPADEEE